MKYQSDVEDYITYKRNPEEYLDQLIVKKLIYPTVVLINKVREIKYIYKMMVIILKTVTVVDI